MYSPTFYKKAKYSVFIFLWKFVIMIVNKGKGLSNGKGKGTDMDLYVKTEGMGCPHCIAKVTKAVTALGAKIKRMELNDFTLSFEGDPAEIKKAVEEKGFKVLSIEEA